MDPSVSGSPLQRTGFPRTRGDGPQTGPASSAMEAFPPHARGMDPASSTSGGGRRRFPRTRGDGPTFHVNSWRASRFPPHARGWTVRRSRGDPNRRVSPARADGPCSPPAWGTAIAFPPHARGWTAIAPGMGPAVGVSPARAGMDPDAPQGEERDCRFPRTRGNGPATSVEMLCANAFPPHARGWTRTGRWESRGESLVTTWWPPPSSNGCSITAT